MSNADSPLSLLHTISPVGAKKYKAGGRACPGLETLLAGSSGTAALFADLDPRQNFILQHNQEFQHLVYISLQYRRALSHHCAC